MRIEGNSCVLIVNDVKDLTTILFPLLDNYNLYTTKWLDYLNFKKVVLFLSESNTTRVPLSQLEEIKNIINNMNKGRTDSNYSLIPNLVVNPFLLLGFIVADFGFKLKSLFQIGPEIKNLFVLEAIASYWNSMPKSFHFSIRSGAPTILNSFNKNLFISNFYCKYWWIIRLFIILFVKYAFSN